MTAQLGFADLVAGRRPPRARRADPDSSHRAADHAERSGAIGRQATTAAEMVELNPGRTSLELAGIGPLDRYQLARRLNEIERGGLVVATMHAGEDLRWWPAGRAPAGLEVRRR